MTDRELLELAARAAGYRLRVKGKYFIEVPSYAGLGQLCLKEWNPLQDDGDALRLAVKLSLKITFDSLSDGAVVEVSIPYDNEWFDYGFFWSEWLNNDPYAATRRAIVRAAAEIGKQMGEE